MTRAIVVGAGIAGPVAGMALHKAGIDAEIFEAYPPPSTEVGSYLTVATNGLDAFRAIDAEHTVLGAGFPTAHNIMYSGTGKRLGTVSNGGRLADGTVAHTVKRARLYHALREETGRRGVPVHHGRRLVAARADGDGVVAEFADGTTETGDVLVGCDGVHSVTRTLIDPAAPSGRYVGLVNFGGYTRDANPPGEPGAWHMMFGRRAFFGYVTDPGGGTVWFANVPRPEVTDEERAETGDEQWRRQLIKLFTADHGPARDLIAAGELQLAGDNTHDLATVPGWHNQRMVILGDAAHAPAPTSGQGASLAAEDAVVLAQCLRDAPTVADALTAYEKLRRHRVERVVAQGARSSNTKSPGPAGRVVRDLMLPLVFRYLVTDKSMAWMYDHHIDFGAPVPLATGTG